MALGKKGRQGPDYIVLKVKVRSLDIIFKVIRSHWGVLNREKHDLILTF